MTPEQIADVLERLERVEQLLADYDQYIKALRRRIDDLEYKVAPTRTVGALYGSPREGRWR